MTIIARNMNAERTATVKRDSKATNPSTRTAKQTAAKDAKIEAELNAAVDSALAAKPTPQKRITEADEQHLFGGSKPSRNIPIEYINPETGNYRPGMDARHAGVVARKVMESGKTSDLNELPTAALRMKAARLVEIWTDKAEAKAEKARLKDAAAEAKALAKAEAAAAK